MSTQIKESRKFLWVLLPTLLSLVGSALVGLQLFQDGSSYLLEMLIDHSAVRHGRVSVLLFQYPTILLVKTFLQREIDPLTTLPIVRLAFNLNYALTPFVSLFLSWLVVRRKREELFLWPALIILFVNLVNFSWVSELLISVQLACPLLLALLENPKSKTFWILAVLLTPFLFFLHPLVIMIYLVLAAAAAYTGYRNSANRRAAIAGAALFLVAAAARALHSYFTLNLYEVSFATPGEISEYFVTSRLENILFLSAAVEIALLILFSQAIVHSTRRLIKAIPWLVVLQAYVLLFFAARFLLRDNLLSLAVTVFLSIPTFIYYWRSRHSSPMDTTRLLYLACAFFAAAASSLLISQYASAERLFTLKAGLDLFVALFIMAIAALDHGREIPPHEGIFRSQFVFALTTIFVCVIVAKSVMWQTSIQRLEQALLKTQEPCVEFTSVDFQWLQKSPYTIINNWSLPSLALVVHDEHPRKALLAEGDCQVLYQSGMIQVDPWSLFSKEFLVPTLE
jgi:hypothetical protein